MKREPNLLYFNLTRRGLSEIDGLHAPTKRQRIDVPAEEIDYRAVWRGIAWGLLFVAPVWIIVFALAWVRWFGS